MSKAKDTINMIDEVRGLKAHNAEVMAWQNDTKFTIAVRTLDGGWKFWEFNPIASSNEVFKFDYINQLSAFNVKPEWGKRVAIKSLPKHMQDTIRKLQAHDRQMKKR
jgi:hypothetical protein